MRVFLFSSYLAWGVHMRLGGLFQPPHFGDLSYVFSDLKNGKFFNRPFVGIGLCDNGPSTVSVRCTNLFEWIRLPVTHAIVLWQSGYGQPGLFQNLNGNFGSHYYPPSNYPAQVAYLPQPPMSYGGGYPPAAVNVSQSFYPSRYGNDPSTSSHHHSSHHPWHLGHYLMGHH